MTRPCPSMWSSESEQPGICLLGLGPAFLLLVLPSDLSSALSFSGAPPQLCLVRRSSLCKALLNCLELGMDVPITHSPGRGVWRMCQRLSCGGSGLWQFYTWEQKSLLNKVGRAHDLPQVPPFPSYTLRCVHPSPVSYTQHITLNSVDLGLWVGITAPIPCKCLPLHPASGKPLLLEFSVAQTLAARR